jgi:positive regulator of sigma E activity
MKVNQRGEAMLVWCTVLFFLGVAAFLDSTFAFGEIFRTVNSVLFMLVSLGLLVRISMKKRLREIETLRDRVIELEQLLRAHEAKRKTSEVVRG